jgi:hypothetical protein
MRFYFPQVMEVTEAGADSPRKEPDFLEYMPRTGLNTHAGQSIDASLIMIGQSGIHYCPILDNLEKKVSGVVLLLILWQSSRHESA